MDYVAPQQSPVFPDASKTGEWLKLWCCIGMLWVGCGQTAFAQPPGPIPQLQENPAEGEQDSDLHSLYYSAHLPKDRRLAQDLDEAERLIDSGRYSEALPLIDRVLAAGEDAFQIDRNQQPTTVATSLKTAAKQLLANLPPAGVTALELDQGVKARRELREAMAAGAFDRIAGVAMRYPQTEAATEAMLVVAQAEVDGGRYGAAARIYEELLSWPAAVANHEALLVVRAAVCHAAAGNQQQLQDALERLRAMTSPVRRGEISQLIGTQDQASWAKDLEEFAATRSSQHEQEGWLVGGGNIARNPLGSGGVPHVWPVWQARTVKQSHVASRLHERIDWQQRHGMLWPLVSSPVAVGDLVVGRTAENIIAVDWRTGRRIWETRPEEISEDSDTLSLPYKSGNLQTAVSLDPVEQRLWIDAIYGAISSDGDRVYAIRNLESLELRSRTRWGMRLFGRQGESPEEEGNTLTAYDLRTEGKLLWEVSGARDGQLEGLFFLGPPLAVDETLYALAELRNSIQLVAIEASSGEVLWKQPLANLERSVQFDLGRRLAGAMPSFSQGLVICPTGAGSVVAVDPIERSLRWAYRFEVDEAVATRDSSGWQQQFGAYEPTVSNRWQRNRCIIVDDAVIVTAPETPALHCLDLLTGELRWTADRNENLYVGGVTDDKVIVVAPTAIEILQLGSGVPIWDKQQLKLPEGTTVAGTGVVTGQQFLLPLSDNRIAVVDLAAGRLSQTVTVREGYEVGNLAFHRGTLLSQSATSLVRFDQLASLREQIANNRKANSNDPQALRIEGEIAWGEGNVDAAIAKFLEANEAAPDDKLIQRRLSSALLAGLTADYARYQQHGDLLAELLEGSLEQYELLRVHINGSLATGDLATAFDNACQLYEVGREATLRLADGHEVCEERWFAARMARIWQAADASLRQEMTSRIGELTRNARQSSEPAAVARLARYFGGIPAGSEARLAHAAELVAAQRDAEAELLLLQTSSTEAPLQLGNLTGPQRELLAKLAPVGASSAGFYEPEDSLAQGIDEWPDGKVHTEVEVERLPVRSTHASNSASRRNRGPARLHVEPRSCGLPWTGPSELALTDISGQPQLVAWNSLGEISHGVMLEVNSIRRSNAPTGITCIRFGHFCVLGTGDDVVALDLRAGGNTPGPELWASQTNRSHRAATRTIQLQGRRVRMALTAEEPAESSRGGELCAAAPLGVVVRSNDQLRCFDPIDGQLLWQRRSMPATGASFGGHEYVFLIGEGQSQGIVLSLVDGSTVGTWSNPAGKVVTTVGRNVVTSHYQSGRRTVRVVDALTGEALVEREFAASVEFTQLAPHLLAWFEKSGQFVLMDAAAGQVRFEQQLHPENGLESIHAVTSDDTLFLAINTRSEAQHNSSGSEAMENAPVVTGHVYALDLNTGEPRWERPASVKAQGFWLMQPAASPVLTFISQSQDRQTNRQNRYTRVLCLDKRTGRSVLREDQLRETDNHTWSMRVDQSSEPSVKIDLRHTQLVVRFTQQPRPPEPVATAGVEGAPKSLSTGLIGIGQRLFGGIDLTPSPPKTDDDD